MAQKRVWIGSEGPFLFDDTDKVLDPEGTYSSENQVALRSESKVIATEVIAYVTSAIAVTDIDDPSTELNAESVDSVGSLVFCYQVSAGNPDEFTMYLWDTDYGAEDPPYIVDGTSGGGWIAVGGKYQTSTKTHKTTVVYSTLTASRLVASNASKELVSSDLASWIAGTADEITVIDDGDGTVTLSLPNNIKVDGLTASTLILADASKKLSSHIKDSHIVDAETSHSITDPADTPADADTLRDDLVTNTIPALESALNALGTKLNSVLSALENAKILETS
jgi:hypothetical protein